MFIDFSSKVTLKKVEEMISAATQDFITSAETEEMISAATENFVTSAQTQEMIDSSLTQYQRIINIRTATPEELISAVTIQNYCTLTYTYSGRTYFEQYREDTQSGESKTVYFYVVGAEADEEQYNIYDVEIGIRITKSNGSYREVIREGGSYAPNVIYNIDKMNDGQKRILSNRIKKMDLYNNNKFYAKWTYNNTFYGMVERYPSGILTGWCPAFEDDEIKFCFVHPLSTSPWIYFSDECYLDAVYNWRS